MQLVQEILQHIFIHSSSWCSRLQERGRSSRSTVETILQTYVSCLHPGKVCLPRRSHTGYFSDDSLFDLPQGGRGMQFMHRPDGPSNFLDAATLCHLRSTVFRWAVSLSCIADAGVCLCPTLSTKLGPRNSELPQHSI